MSRSWTRLVGGLAVVAMLVATVIGPVTASGGGGGAYKAVIAPSSIAAGTTTQQVLTLTQLANGSQQRVNSFRVGIPADLSVSNVSAKRGTTTLTNVNVGSSSVTINSVGFTGNNQTVKVTMDVAVACGNGGSRSWTVVAQNALAFATGDPALAQDAASDLGTSIDKCSLSWVHEPALAQQDETITSEDADPSGTPVEVRVLDGTGANSSQSGISIDLDIVAGPGSNDALHGDAASTDSHGVATFSPNITVIGRGYELKAGAVGITSSPDSQPFEIDDFAKRCSGSCSSEPTTKGNTTVNISVDSTGILTMSLGLDDVSCDDPANHFYKTTSQTVTWDVTSGTGRVEGSIRIDSSAVTRPYNLYDLCFVSSVGFRNRYNIKIKPGEPGLLKICPPRLDPEPCVRDKRQLSDGSVEILFSVPWGDPHGKL